MVTNVVPAPIICVLGRDHVESQDCNEFLKALLPMTLSLEAVRDFGNRLMVAFEGYENDDREVYCIPEVRQFIQSVHQQFPYWFHYCGKNDESLFVVVMCLMPLGVTVVREGVASTQLVPGAWRTLAKELFVSMNRLYKRHGLTAAEQSNTTRLVGEYAAVYF